MGQPGRYTNPPEQPIPREITNMTTRRIVTLTLALIAVAAAGNVQAKQFLKVSEVAARKAQLASGHTVPQADAIDALQQQAQAQDSGIGYGEGMIPTQSATPTADYPDLEAISNPAATGAGNHRFNPEHRQPAASGRRPCPDRADRLGRQRDRAGAANGDEAGQAMRP